MYGPRNLLLGDGGSARYITPVKTFLAILVALLMLGHPRRAVRRPVRPGARRRQPGPIQPLMRWRVILQGAALLLFALLMTLLRS